MKKAIISPLCSAFIIPGLGQIINQHIKKGLFMLAAIFVFIIFFTLRLYLLINTIIKSGAINTGDPEVIMDKIMAENPAAFIFMFLGFSVLWIYSVIDAFLGGRKADKLDEVETS